MKNYFQEMFGRFFRVGFEMGELTRFIEIQTEIRILEMNTDNIKLFSFNDQYSLLGKLLFGNQVQIVVKTRSEYAG